MSGLRRYENVNVSIAVGRWDVTLTIEQPGVDDVVLIASADSFFTESSGIWFGTLAEYDEDSAR